MKGTVDAVMLLGAASAVGGFLLAAVVKIYFAPAVEELAARTLGRWLRKGNVDVRGIWKSEYEYPSRGELKVTIQMMDFRQVGRSVYAKKVGGESPHAHSLMIKIEGHYLTGTWVNKAEKANHHGVMQFRLTADGSELLGRWVGFDSAGVVQGGSWTMKRI